MAKTLLEQTKRQRIKGDGPRRHELPVFAHLATAGSQIVDELNYILDTHPTKNDIGGDNYAITRSCDYKTHFEVDTDTQYRQILLQRSETPVDGKVDEFLYDTWNPDYKLRYTKMFMDSIFDQTYRFRLSEMKGASEIGWHIDTDTSVACRAQICLNENDSVFEFKDRSGVHQLRMKPGELWFINSGWSHRVVSGDMTRRVAVFSFKYSDLSTSYKEILND